MSFTVFDRVKESSSTTGTGAITLSGAASNYVTFNTGVGLNNFTWYCINNLSANEWEVGYGQLTGATTLTRISVTAGTNGTSFVNFSAGTKEVFVTQPSAFNNQTLGRTNIIINPHGSIQQETTTPVTTGPAYFADQWLSELGAGVSGKVQIGVFDNAVSYFGEPNLYAFTTTPIGSLAASDFAILSQRIEGFTMRRLRYGGASAKGSWLRWRASADVSGTASVAIRNAATDRSFVQSFAVTTTPTDYFLFVPGDTTGTWPTSNTHAATVSFCYCSGTTFQTSTLGAWHAGNFIAANTQTNFMSAAPQQLSVTDVQWSQSAVLLPFEPIDYQQELARCQRYYFKLSGSIDSAGGGAPSTSWQNVNIFLPVEMRVAPTSVAYQDDLGTANQVQYRSANGGTLSRGVLGGTTARTTFVELWNVDASKTFFTAYNIRISARF